MTATDVLARLEGLGVKVQARGDRLRLVPGARVTPELLEAVRANKPALLAHLSAAPAKAAPVPPPAALPVGRDRPCPSCDSRRRWRCPALGTRWLCPRCHPPHRELEPLEWIGPEDEPGWTVGAIRACVRCGRGTAVVDPNGHPMHPCCARGD